jgi:hypothetical protein
MSYVISPIIPEYFSTCVFSGEISPAEEVYVGFGTTIGA